MFWNSAEKKGYSGTAVLTRVKPKNVWNGHRRGGARHGGPGARRGIRGLLARQRLPAQLPARPHAPGLPRQAMGPGVPAVPEKAPVKGQAGRVLRRPERGPHARSTWRTRRRTGATPASRTRSARASAACSTPGFVDTFREFEKGPGHYTWWSQMGDCRRPEHRVARRLLRGRREAASRAEAGVDQPGDVMGSDHCPVGLELG